MEATTLTEYQKQLAEAQQFYVVGRWGRRTGKDTVIKAITQSDIDKRDIIIYPAQMHHHYREEFGNQAVSDMAFTESKLKGVKPMRIFIAEPAFISRLHKLLELLDEHPHVVKQLYLIGTPAVHPRISSSGFLFDAICARLELAPMSEYYYSRQGATNNPFIKPELMKQLEKDLPNVREEMLGEFNGQEPIEK